jgi:hypothetical protein
VRVFEQENFRSQKEIDADEKAVLFSSYLGDRKNETESTHSPPAKAVETAEAEGKVSF